MNPAVGSHRIAAWMMKIPKASQATPVGRNNQTNVAALAAKARCLSFPIRIRNRPAKRNAAARMYVTVGYPASPATSARTKPINSRETISKT